MDEFFTCERCAGVFNVCWSVDMVFRRGDTCERVLEVCSECEKALLERGWSNAHVGGAYDDDFDPEVEAHEADMARDEAEEDAEPTQPPCECDGCWEDFDVQALSPIVTTRVVRVGWDGHGFVTWLVCAECLPTYVGSGFWRAVG